MIRCGSRTKSNDFLFSAKLKCLFALTVASSGLQLEVVLRKGQRLLDRGPYTGAWTEAALAPRAAAHRTSPPSPAVTGRRGRGAYDAPSRRVTQRNATYGILSYIGYLSLC